MPDVAIVDYGAGNLASVWNALAALGSEPRFVRTAAEVRTASRLVLPGIGAGGAALEKLRANGLDDALTEAVRVRGRPLLGICLGMQLIAERLYEYGEHRGFGWIRGEVVSLRDVGVRNIVPHMGWNDVAPQGPAAVLFEGIPTRKRQFYFSHSYTLRTDDPDVVAAYTDYDVPIVSAVLDGTVFAVQFHPEKSQQGGRELIAAFLEWNP